MKPTLLFATLSILLAMPKATAASELETLRVRCSEQERLIQQLKEENAKLQSGSFNSGTTTAIAPAKSTGSAETTYTVRAGDSLELIARRNGCSPESIAESNRLKNSSIIHPGQKLKIPATNANQSKPAAATPSSLAGKTHKIQQGETYSSISRKYGVSVNSLIACNPKVKPTALRPGQVIALSSATTATSAPRTGTVAASPTPRSTPSVAAASKPPEQKAPTPEAKPAAADAIQTLEATPAPSNEKKIHSVSIEGEMTYGEFAAKYGTDAARLNDLNGLDLVTTTILAKGSELYVPAQP